MCPSKRTEVRHRFQGILRKNRSGTIPAFSNFGFGEFPAPQVWGRSLGEVSPPFHSRVGLEAAREAIARARFFFSLHPSAHLPPRLPLPSLIRYFFRLPWFRLILFDIDGTLIRLRRRGSQSVRQSIRNRIQRRRRSRKPEIRRAAPINSLVREFFCLSPHCCYRAKL